jgi:mannose-6-phosphate isomerase-like protein (cupin superfamily)
MIVVHADMVPAQTTESGTQLRVLLDTTGLGQGRISLAMETLRPGQRTVPHWHEELEEIYYILQGRGRMVIAEELQDVRAGDAILIRVRAVHCLHNTGDQDLVLLCPVSPPWYAEDYHSVGEATE